MQKKLSSRHLRRTIDFQSTGELLSLPAGITEEQIAIGKGFSAYIPVIKRSFRVNKKISLFFYYLCSVLLSIFMSMVKQWVF
jgi:hypothetical protein